MRAWVDRTSQSVDHTFWLHIEASGPDIEMPVIPEIDNLIISPNPSQQSRSWILTGRERHETVQLGYPATAVRPGSITIPAIKIVIGGKAMYTEPIPMIVTGAEQAPAEARVWADTDTVEVGKPFWLHMEATGKKVKLPGQFTVDGLTIDFKNAQRRRSSSSSSGVRRWTERHDLYCTPRRTGALRIPSLEIVVDGRTVMTEPLVLKAVAELPPARPVAQNVEERQELYKDDLLFIRMETDKTEVYQGEPILLTKQLWRIVYGRINSGAARGGVIIPPSTEGFYVSFLDPVTRDAKKDPWNYEVTEERMVLYPTAIGSLKVGQWHWEGIAIVNQRSILSNNRLHYKLNVGPININVRPLPERPEGFSGAVGRFSVNASLSSDTIAQGVPVALVLTVTGQGNPDGIGAPVLPDFDWAHVGEPERSTNTYVSPDQLMPTVERTFRYALTPLVGGNVEIPEIHYVFFDPEDEAYKTESVGPFKLAVRASSNPRAARLMLADDIDLDERSVDILDEDIRSIITVAAPLNLRQSSPAALPFALAFPVVAYIALAAYMGRRRRFERDTAFARAYRAKAKARKRLQQVMESAEPADELYRALLGFIADTFNAQEAGMTSDDVRSLAAERGIPRAIGDQAVKILRACERARYASQDFSADEIQALVEGAEASLADFEEAAREAAQS